MNDFPHRVLNSRVSTKLEWDRAWDRVFENLVYSASRSHREASKKPHIKLSSKPISAGRYVVITGCTRAGQVHKVTSVRVNSFSTVYIENGKPVICCFRSPFYPVGLEVKANTKVTKALPIRTRVWI